MEAKLKVLKGSHQGKEIPISSEKFLIGRSDSCHLRPKSESISRKHCIIVLRDGKVLIQDLKSRNGTFINEKRLPSDRAKVLREGDCLRVGKLAFEVHIEHGLGGAKRPEVSGVDEAAQRMVDAGTDGSRFEAVDVSGWLEEADQIERVRRDGANDTRQFRLDQLKASDSDAATDGSGDASVSLEMSSSDSDSSKIKRPEKKKPGKLPSNFKKAMKENSRDAADDALKKFFTR